MFLIFNNLINGYWLSEFYINHFQLQSSIIGFSLNFYLLRRSRKIWWTFWKTNWTIHKVYFSLDWRMKNYLLCSKLFSMKSFKSLFKLWNINRAEQVKSICVAGKYTFAKLAVEKYLLCGSKSLLWKFLKVFLKINRAEQIEFS